MITTKKKKSSLKPTTTSKKIITFFKILVLTRHPSQSPLRTQLPRVKGRAVVRLGSTTVLNDGKVRTEVNSVQGVKNSASKLLMKQCFTRGGVKTTAWKNGTSTEILAWADQVGYPIVSKSHFGSRGVGNRKHDDKASLTAFIRSNPSGYIYEKFQPLGREYRLHISKFGCFYACRKLLRNDAPEGSWQLHSDCVNWVLENNPSFKKPANWNAIVEDCMRAQQALGLDICAFDVMVSVPKKDSGNSEWLITESCSAPAFGDITLQKYLEEIPKIINSKNGRGN
jgi:hypothetical protein